MLKLYAIDKSADIVSSLASHIAVSMVIALFFLIINIEIALWIRKLLGESCYGFFIIGGFYALVAVLLYIFVNQVIITND